MIMELKMDKILHYWYFVSNFWQKNFFYYYTIIVPCIPYCLASSLMISCCVLAESVRDCASLLNSSVTCII